MGSRNALPEDFHPVIRMVEPGAFPVDETVSVTVPMSAAADAIAEWDREPSRFSKIMIDLE